MSSPDRINNPTLNDHASGIGYLCFMYNGLEARVNNLLGLLAKLNDTDLQCFTNQYDLLKKLGTLRAFAHEYKLSQLWYDDIDLMCWAVENKIIKKRNRFVHDIWIALPDVAVRRYERLKIEKPQSRQSTILTTHEHIPTKADEIWELVHDTKDVSNVFRLLHAAHKSGRAKTNPEESYPQEYRQLWLNRRFPPKSQADQAPKPAQQ